MKQTLPALEHPLRDFARVQLPFFCCDAKLLEFLKFQTTQALLKAAGVSTWALCFPEQEVDVAVTGVAVIF
jgi:hypothetical protein